MQEDRQNKQIQSAIDGLEQIPGGFVFNNQQVWAKLEPQLTVAKKKRPVLYYAAAAALLVTGTIYLFLIKNETKQVVNTPTAAVPVIEKKNAEAVVVHQNKIIHQHNLAGSVHPVQKKYSQPVNTEVPVQKETAGIETQEVLPIPVTNNQVAVTVSPATELQKQEPKKLPAIVLAKPVPKKYKVIHIDELNPAVSTPDPLNNISRYEFRKIIQQQNEERETLLPPDNNVKQILFFKLKPSTTTTTTIVEN